MKKVAQMLQQATSTSGGVVSAPVVRKGSKEEYTQMVNNMTEETAVLFALANRKYFATTSTPTSFKLPSRESGRMNEYQLSIPANRKLLLASIARAKNYIGVESASKLYNQVKTGVTPNMANISSGVPEAKYERLKDISSIPEAQLKNYKIYIEDAVFEYVKNINPEQLKRSIDEAKLTGQFEEEDIRADLTESGDFLIAWDTFRLMESADATFGMESKEIMNEIGGRLQGTDYFPTGEVVIDRSEEALQASTELSEEQKQQDTAGVVDPDVQQEAEGVITNVASDVPVIEPLDAGTIGSESSGASIPPIVFGDGGAGAGAGSEYLFPSPPPTIVASETTSEGGAGEGAGVPPSEVGSEVGIEDNEISVPSVYIQSIGGLQQKDNIKHFQKEALSIYFGSSKSPAWDNTLLTDRIRRWKEMSDDYKKTTALRENRGLASIYGKEFLLSGNLENGLYTNEASPVKDVLIENEEILQLFQCYKRNLAKGARIPTATMNVNQLMQFRNELAGVPPPQPVPEGDNALTPTGTRVDMPTQPTPIDVNIPKPALPLFEQWRNRKHGHIGLRNPAPNSVVVAPTMQTEYKAPLDPQVSTYYGKIPSVYKIKSGTDKENACKIKNLNQ